MVEPIKPSDIFPPKIPDKVIEAFNLLISNSYHNGTAVVKQDEIVELLVSGGMDRKAIFEKRLLDIEPLYSEHWIVVYDKPAFNETYPATFTFTAKE